MTFPASPISPEREQQLHEFEFAVRELMQKFEIPRLIADVKIADGPHGELNFGMALMEGDADPTAAEGSEAFIRAAQRLLTSGMKLRDGAVMQLDLGKASA